MSDIHNYVRYSSKTHKCRCDICRADMARYAREYRKRFPKRDSERFKERIALVNKIKLDAGCADCGYNKHPSALDFDHVRGEKSFILARNLGRKWELVQAEIDKCEVVCANCHRIRTVDRLRAAR